MLGRYPGHVDDIKVVLMFGSPLSRSEPARLVSFRFQDGACLNKAVVKHEDADRGR